MNKINVPAIVNNLIKLQHDYAFTYRSIVTEERYKNLVEVGLLRSHNYDSPEIREPLIEHIGHLPIIATFLHQFIENKDKVDLGRVLLILSVHDIGETKVGDILTYSKPDSHKDLEFEAAKELLPDYLFNYFQEYEKAESYEGKFAKAVDSIAPLLHELTLPKVTRERFKYHNFNVEKIIAKKKNYFQWDAVLAEIFDYIIGRLKEIENQE